MNPKPLTPLQARHKLEQFCAYQDRCHQEVKQKIYALRIDRDLADELIAQLISSGFLDEERFARSFARGKHRIKHWGRVRITSELRARQISAYNMKAALNEIEAEYEANFLQTAQNAWDRLLETDAAQRKQKLHAYLYRKGYEPQLILDFLQGL